MIQVQCGNGRPPNRCVTDDAVTVPTKMCMPVVCAWVKQVNLAARIRVDAFNAVGLMQIAARTRPREIVHLPLSTARLWDDMLDVKCSALQ